MQAVINLSHGVDGPAALAMHRVLLEKTEPSLAGRGRTERPRVGGAGIPPHGATLVAPHPGRVGAAVARCGRSSTWSGPVHWRRSADNGSRRCGRRAGAHGAGRVRSAGGEAGVGQLRPHTAGLKRAIAHLAPKARARREPREIGCLNPDRPRTAGRPNCGRFPLAYVTHLSRMAPDSSRRPHRETAASWHQAERDGEPVFQLDSYGSPDRRNTGAKSQSLQFDAVHAQELVDAIRTVFRSVR